MVEFAFMLLYAWVVCVGKTIGGVWQKLTQANLYYSSRHKRDNYWCGSQNREKRRMIAEEKGEGVR